MEIEDSEFNSKTNQNSDFDKIKLKENDNANNNVNNFSGEDAFKEELLTLEELKKSQNKEYKIENNNFDKKVKYDLDENWNKEYIVNVLKSEEYDDNKKAEEFNKVMYKLSYEDRINLFNEYKHLFDMNRYKNIKKKQKDVFISFLKTILGIKKEEETISIQANDNIKIQSSNIPYIEGSEEYIYRNLINKAYETFVTLSGYIKYKKDGTRGEGLLVSNMLDPENNNPVINPLNIISNNENEIKEEEKIIEGKEEKEEEMKFDFENFLIKKNLLEPVLTKYCSEEFQIKYEEFIENYPELIKDKRVKYIYEIALEALFYYSTFLNEKNKFELVKEYAEIFYETERKKKKYLKNYSYLIKIKEKKGKDDIDFNLENTIKNKEYNVYISNKRYKLNLFDYKIKSLTFVLSGMKYIQEKNKEQFINNILNNPLYWTLQKQIKVNSLYNDDELNNLFKKDVNKMLKHKVLEKVFNKVKMFEAYKYPFLKEGFLEQVHKNIVYIKLPTKIILGLTLKEMGIVIINKGRHNDVINDQLDKNSKFLLKLSESAFYKVTLIHEINFHYFLVILYSNKKINALTTPKKVFKGEMHIKGLFDFGDKGEIALFGSTISILFIRGIIDIIQLNSWEKNKNKDLVEIKNAFFNINKELKKDYIKIEELFNLNSFTHCLYKIINQEKEIQRFIPSIGVGNLFCSGKILNFETDKIIFDGDFGKIIPRGLCFNSFRLSQHYQ